MISIDLLNCGEALATDIQPNLKLLRIPHGVLAQRHHHLLGVRSQLQVVLRPTTASGHFWGRQQEEGLVHNLIAFLPPSGLHIILY